MRYANKQILVRGALSAAVICSAACSPRTVHPLTVEDLMEDRVMLDGILMKCNQTPPRANNPTDCENARVAIERLAKDDVDPAVEKKRQEAFEQAREKLRLAQDKLRQEQEAKTKVDAYSLPVVPVEPPSQPKPDSPAKTDPQASAFPGNATLPPLAGANTR